MTRIAQGVVLFSDDVREEIGGKSSYMGLLGPEVWVHAEKSVSFVCTLLLWVIDPQVTVSADFKLENAPEGVSPPPPFTRTVTKQAEDGAAQWVVQMVGRLRFRVGNQPLLFEVTFSVGDQTFSNRIIFDPMPDDAQEGGSTPSD
jgi:hypothetical protein